MNVKQIAPDFAVTGQISVADVPAIAKAGYKTLICNRPDKEGWGQPPHADIKAAAEKEGMTFHYIPVVPGFMNPDNLSDFSKAMAEATRPVLAYCASGNRAGNLYSVWQREQASARG